MIPNKIQLNFSFKNYKTIASLLCILLCFLNNSLVFAQSDQPGSVFPKVIPPSPEASSLGRFAEIPVSLYTGTPSISIPLYEVESGKLKVPISLQYHGSGVKVEEMASWVGIGWTLDAGGVITRTVKGKPDDSDYGQGFFRYSPGKSVQWLLSLSGAAKASEMQSLSDGSVDAEPDQYYLNANGITAKFSFDWNGNIIQNQEKKLLIKKLQDTGSSGNPHKILGWDVIDENGIVYKFREIETTTTDAVGLIGPTRNGTFASSWYLSEITDENNDNSISFIYDSYVLDYGFRGSISITHGLLGGGPCFPISGVNGSLSQSTSHTIVQGKRIKEILSTGGNAKLLFSPGPNRTDTQQLWSSGYTSNFKPLDNILISNLSGEEIKRIKIATDYSTGRLTLRSVIPQKGTVNLSPPYSISYHAKLLPSALSNAQDHWGYFNNKTSNPHLVPAVWAAIGYSSGNSYLPGANREPDSEYVLAGTITKLTYPTGGYSEFDFEAHNYGYVQSTPVVRYKVDNVNTSATMTEQEIVGTNYTKTVGFVVNTNPYNPSSKTPVSINWSAFTDAATGAKKPRIKLYKSTDYANPILNFVFGIQDPNLVQTGNTQMELEAGTYYLEVTCYIFDEINDFATIAVNYNNYNTNIIYKTNPAGGVRVREVRQYASSNDLNFTTRKYLYIMESDPERSSGVLNQEPLYGYYHTLKCKLSEQGENETGVYTRLSNGSTILGADQNNHIGYREVQVLFGNGINTNGKTLSKFSSSFDITDYRPVDLPFRPAESRDFKRGLLKEEITYSHSSGTYLPVKKVQNFYQYLEYNNPGMTSLFMGGLQLDYNYLTGAYLQYFGKSVIATSVETVYPSDIGTSNLLITKEFFYDPSLSRIKKTTFQLKDNEKLISEYFYPSDYTSPSASITEMSNRNMTGIVLEEVKKKQIGGNEFIISGQHNEYSISANKLRLLKKRSLTLTNPISTGFNYSINNANGIPEAGYKLLVNFDSYDAKGNILQYTPFQGLPRSYKWGYSSSYPIAEVENAMYSQIFYTSFEDDGVIGNSITGKSFFSGATYSIPLYEQPTGSNLYMTYWYFNGQWNFQSEIPYNPTISQAGATGYDEVRVYPKGAFMQTYSYEPEIGLTSITDSNNRTTFYKYDLNRLKWIYDHNHNITQQFNYNYKGNN